jgi:serine/threonine protein kinase
MTVEKGTMITDNVRLDTLLGEGGMGSVWIADHLHLEQQVAVKFISTELLERDATVRARFNREAALAAQIISPHVVKILDLGVMDDGTPFFVMEHLAGENLGERLERAGTLSLVDARKVVTETAMALARAHQLGIVHRDIKPDNLFLVESDESAFVKVLDFGIAKQDEMPGQSVVTMTGTMMGTPEFMSPEQVLSAKGVDHRSDLWSLGVVAYYALTGGVPFSGETLGSVCVAIAAGEFVPASTCEPGLPPAIDRWFDRALAVVPEDRFQTARDMARAFSKALGPLGKPQEDDFSRTGSLKAPAGGDWFGDTMDEESEPDSGGEQPAVSAGARTILSKRVATFSGASLATDAPGRQLSRVAIRGFAIGGLLVLGVASLFWAGSGPETSGPAPVDAASAPTDLAAPSALGTESAVAAPTETTSAAPPEASATGSGGSGGASAAASGVPTSEPSADKTVATKPRPRPKSTAEPKAPSASGTASHAPAPSASTEIDRGF